MVYSQKWKIHVAKSNKKQVEIVAGALDFTSNEREGDGRKQKKKNKSRNKKNVLAFLRIFLLRRSVWMRRRRKRVFMP